MNQDNNDIESIAQRVNQFFKGRPMTPEELKVFHAKESHMAEGINADFVWYEASVIREALKHAFSVNMHRFDKVVSVMEARHKEHIKMLQDVMDQNRDLKREVAALKAANASPKEST